MATKRLRSSGKWEVTVKNKRYFEKPQYFQFDTEEEADAWSENIESQMAQGIDPKDLHIGQMMTKAYTTLKSLILDYEHKAAVGVEDKNLLAVLAERIGHTKFERITIQWSEAWVSDMKLKENLAPTTIRHYVGALARCFDWASRRGVTQVVRNPLRLLPKGYSTYTDRDIAYLSVKGLGPKANTRRDRRLEEGEENAIRLTMAGAKREDRERAMEMPYREALIFMFDLALESAMRMREIYTLTLDQADLKKRTFFLDKTKNGSSRQVPMTTVIAQKLEDYVKLVASGGLEGYTFGEDYRLFPWWNGDRSQKSLTATTSLVSGQFRRIFEYAGLTDFHFHDLRHEATSRMFERTTLDYLQIAKITGHKDPRMLMVYANLRASDLADKLW